MPVDRRDFFASCGAAIAGASLGGCRLGASGTRPEPSDYDRLVGMHAVLPPESSGGANHYPMAADALRELAPTASLPSEWFDGVRYYDAPLSRRAPLGEFAEALGDIDRHGDWLDHFRDELRTPSWCPVVADWARRLAPGLSGAMFHGLIRTGHAVRSLQRRDTTERRDEVAAGLAYWASRYAELPTTNSFAQAADLLQSFANVEPHSVGDEEPGFHEVMAPVLTTPFAAPLQRHASETPPRQALQSLVLATTTALLEMLQQERNRIWLLHNVTGPAAVELLLPIVDANTARDLVAYAQQAALAFHRAYGAPFVPEASLRGHPRSWRELTAIAVERRTMHGLKLFEALRRCGGDARIDRVARSTAEQWLDWV